MLLVNNMEINNKTVDRKKSIQQLIIFLVLELLLLVGFNLGDLGFFYRIIALVLAILILPNVIDKDQKGIKQIILLLLPSFLLGVASMFSPVFGYPPNGIFYESDVYLNIPFYEVMMLFLGGMAFSVLGYTLRRVQISKEIVIGVIIAGLSALVLINLIITIYNYGLFHRIIYADKILFYNGKVYDVAPQASALIGFEVVNVSHSYLTTQAVIVLSTSFSFLFFKKGISKTLRNILIFGGVISLLSLINFADITAFLFLIPALILVLSIKFKLMKHMSFKIILSVFAALAFVLIFIGILSALNVNFINQLINSNPITIKLYHNSISTRFVATVKQILTPSNFLGSTEKAYSLSATEYGVFFPTGNIILDVAKTKGIIGLVGILALISITIVTSIKYLKKSNDDLFVKAIIFCLLITTFFRYMLFNPFSFYTYKDDFWFIDNHAFTQSSMYLITLFILGFMTTQNKNDSIQVENQESNTSEVIYE